MLNPIRPQEEKYPENPNPKADIGFVLFYPFQFFVMRNVYKHLADRAEFIVDLGAFFPIRQMPEAVTELVELLTKHKVYFRVLAYEAYPSQLGKFFAPYEVLASLWLRRGCFRFPAAWRKKKVYLNYGLGKELTVYGLWKRHYDLILAYGKRDHDIFSLYTNSEMVGNPKFDDWFNETVDGQAVVNLQKQLDASKKTLLYLPTHGDLSSLDVLTDYLKELSDEFNIVVKLHYYTVYEELGRVKKITQPPLIIFKDNADLLPLLKVADVVLSDNSSVIFDAILADKPLILADFWTPEYLETEHKIPKHHRRGTARALTYSGSIEQRIKRDGLVPTFTKPQNLRQSVREAPQDQTHFKHARSVIRSELFAFNDGKCGQRAAAAIEKLLSESKKPERPVLFHLIEALQREIGEDDKATRELLEYTSETSRDVELGEKVDLHSQHKLLKDIIQNEVFATKKRGKIVSPSGAESNWIFDFRNVLLQPGYLDLISDIFWAHFEKEYPFQVGGQETAAIPLVTAIVLKGQRIGKPVNGFYIRKSRKPYGLQNIIEGRVTNEKIIIIDDLLNSGKTFMRQIEVLAGVNQKPDSIFAIIRFKGQHAYGVFSERGIKVATLFSLEDFGLPLIEDKKHEIPRDFFKIVWYFQSTDPNHFYVVPKSTPVLDGERLYFGSDSGYFWALRQLDGTVAWQYKVGWNPKGKAIFSSPAIYKDIVYFGAYDGNVYALDTKTGKPRWIFMEADWVESSPAVASELNLLFIGVEFGLFTKRGSMVALDLATGEKRWEYVTPKPMTSSPAYLSSKKIVAVGNADGYVYLLHAKSGKLVTSFQIGSEVRSSCAFYEKSGLLICGASNGYLYGINVDSGEKAIQFKTYAPIYSTPLLIRDRVILASLDKQLYCLDLNSGRHVWTFRADRRIFASPVAADERIYIGANDGRLYEIDPDTGEVTGFFQATERITNRVVYNEQTKRFFLPTYANEIYCLERIVQS